MAKVVLDANVIVGLLDEYDSLSGRATRVLEEVHSAGDSQLLLDFVVAEAISVICRRASERKKNIPDLPAVLDQVNRWYQRDQIEFVQGMLEGIYPDVLDIVKQSDGSLNFNDATLVALQRRGFIGEVATFDATLASQPDFRTVG
jgi:predicted nucleic acid-binding protein